MFNVSLAKMTTVLPIDFLYCLYIRLLFIIESYTKYKIDRKTETENKKEKAANTTRIQSTTHSREQVNNIVTCKPDRQS